MPTDRRIPGPGLRVVLDSFAWVEYFSGSKAGARVREYLETVEVLTPTIVMAELSEKYRRLGEELGPRFDFIRNRSRMVQLDDELARLAGETNFQRKKRVKGWGMADSIVLATGRQWRAKIVTGDPHFEDLGEDIIQI